MESCMFRFNWHGGGLAGGEGVTHVWVGFCV